MAICPTLIGRESEFARLMAALNGPGEVLFVYGEAGIGKSRLLREFASVASLEGWPVVWARPEVITAPGPYSLILDLLDNIAATLPRTSAQEARDLFDQLLEPSSNQLDKAASLPRHIAARIRGIIASEKPTPIVILEDLHAVDAASLNVVFHLGRTSRDDGRILVASTRTDAKSFGEGLSRVAENLRHDRVLTEIILERLDSDQVLKMVHAILGRDPDPELLYTIETFGEGIPFFLEELTPDQRTAHDGDSSEPLPRSIRENVARHFETLTEPVQDLLLTAALLDGPLDPHVLASACSVSSGAMQSLARDAVDAGLLQEHDGYLMFRHALVRHVIASISGLSDRQRRHGRLATSLESLHATRSSNAWQIATQLNRAGASSRAAEYALKAADHALSLAATGDARAAFQAAKEWTSDKSIMRRAQDGLALVELREGNERAAAQIGREVVDGLLADGLYEEAAAALGRLSLVLTRSGDLDRAHATLNEALTLVGTATDSPIAARLITQKANFLIFYLGQFDEAEELIDRAAAMSSALSNRAVLAVALDGKAAIIGWRGLFSQAEYIGDQSVAEALDSQDPEAIGRTHNNHAVRLVLHGRAKAGIEVLSKGREFIERKYGSAGVSSLHITRAWIHQMMGEPLSALELLRNLQSVWMGWRGLAAAIKTWAHVERGELAEASLVIKNAWQEAGYEDWRGVDSQSEVAPDVIELLASEIHMRIALGELPEAAGAAKTYLEVSEAAGQPSEWTRARALGAMTYALAGQLPRARVELKALEVLLDERPYPFWLGAHAETTGVVALAERDDELALESFGRGASHYASCSNMLDQARCLRRAGDTLARRSSAREAMKETLSRARDLALSCGALVEQSRTEAQLRAIGVRPRAGRPRKQSARTGPLSAREEQIASLVASGATNPEIAKRLYLSEGTVAGYISGALRKLQLSGRAALAAWAAKAGLI